METVLTAAIIMTTLSIFFGSVWVLVWAGVALGRRFRSYVRECIRKRNQRRV